MNRVIRKRTVFYNGKEYTIDEWMSEVCSFNKTKNGEYYIKNQFVDVGKKEILRIFNKNIKKHSFLGLILPCALFLVLFLLSVFFIVFEQEKGNFELVGKGRSLIFLSFVSLLFLVLGIILLFKTLVKKEKCYLSKKAGQYRYTFISSKKYCEICAYLSEEE